MKELTIDSPFKGSYHFTTMENESGLHVQSGALSILIDSLKLSHYYHDEDAGSHYCISMLINDTYVGTIDLFTKEDFYKLKTFFSIK
jgi:hypothetical protein